jgi:tRNA nucleotidyltransferase (CCA-adding enzyme)
MNTLKLKQLLKEYNYDKKELFLFEEILLELKNIFNPLTFQCFGSIAKRTFVRNHKELDLFFKGDHFEKTLSSIKNILETNICFKNIRVKKGGHPYINCNYIFKGKEYQLDLVPFYGVIGSSDVERTTLHKEYVLKKIEAGLLDNRIVRLIKEELVKRGLYGAESQIEGISGYAVEILCENVFSLTDIQNISKKIIQGIRDPCDEKRDLLSSLSYYNRCRLCYFFKNFEEYLLLDLTSLVNENKKKIIVLEFSSFKGQNEGKLFPRVKKFIEIYKILPAYINSIWNPFTKQLYIEVSQKYIERVQVKKYEELPFQKYRYYNNQFCSKNTVLSSNCTRSVKELTQIINFNNLFSFYNISKQRTTKKIVRSYLLFSLTK